MIKRNHIFKWLIIGVTISVAILVLFGGYRYVADKQDFEDAKKLATRMIQTQTFEFPDISKTGYNPFTRWYFVYFQTEDGKQMLAKINMASKDDNGQLNQCIIVKVNR